MRADIVPGGIFPDYDLTDHAKTRRRLSELQGIDPMILVLSRGGFCPKDHQQHVELAANYPKIRRRRAFSVIIFPITSLQLLRSSAKGPSMAPEQAHVR